MSGFYRFPCGRKDSISVQNWNREALLLKLPSRSQISNQHIRLALIQNLQGPQLRRFLGDQQIAPAQTQRPQNAGKQRELPGKANCRQPLFPRNHPRKSLRHSHRHPCQLLIGQTLSLPNQRRSFRIAAGSIGKDLVRIGFPYISGCPVKGIQNLLLHVCTEHGELTDFHIGIGKGL